MTKITEPDKRKGKKNQKTETNRQKPRHKFGTALMDFCICMFRKCERLWCCWCCCCCFSGNDGGGDGFGAETNGASFFRHSLSFMSLNRFVTLAFRNSNKHPANTFCSAVFTFHSENTRSKTGKSMQQSGKLHAM